MDIRRAQIDTAFWGRWTVASALGFTIGGMLSLPIAYTLGELVLEATSETAGFAVTGALFGIFLGGGLGAGQQIVLKSKAGWGGKWALVSAAATAVVWAIAFPALLAAGETASSPTGVTIAILFGLTLGIGQWLVLRNFITRAARWVLIVTASLALAFVAAFALDGEGRELLSMGVAGLLSGALTGLGMAWLLRDPAPVSAS
ncbi:MAG: hypothetical protein JSW55_16085 [Chloroflexota bacterium]|nr:MAG: hypothetical protein JSW55_16085 [Chloroflexota bacterium]